MIGCSNFGPCKIFNLFAYSKVAFRDPGYTTLALSLGHSVLPVFNRFVCIAVPMVSFKAYGRISNYRYNLQGAVCCVIVMGVGHRYLQVVSRLSEFALAQYWVHDFLWLWQSFDVSITLWTRSDSLDLASRRSYLSYLDLLSISTARQPGVGSICLLPGQRFLLYLPTWPHRWPWLCRSPYYLHFPGPLLFSFGHPISWISSHLTTGQL